MKRVFITFGIEPDGSKHMIRLSASMALALKDKGIREKATREGVRTDYTSYEIQTWQVHS